MSVVRRLRRAVGDTARALPLAREASAQVARRRYAQRVHRFVVEKSGLADPRPDGIVYETSERDDGPALPVEAFARSIPRRHLGHVNLTGDRPFVRHDILDVLEVFRAKGYRCDYLTTDGSSLTPARTDALAHLAAQGFLRHVSVSAECLAGAGDRGQEAEGSAAIRGLMAAAGRRDEPLRLIVNATVRSETLESLDHVADVAKSMGADRVGLTHLMFATPDEVDETLRLVGETDPATIATAVTRDPGIIPSRVRAQEAALRRRCKTLGLQFDHRPKVDDAILEDFYTPGARLDGRCLYPFLHARVSCGGQVVFCPFIRIVVGDLATQTLEEVWNAPRYQALRKTLLEHQLFPVCQRCCKVELTGTRLPRPVRIFTAPLPAMAGNL